MALVHNIQTYYECDICAVQFPKNHELKVHIATEHEEKKLFGKENISISCDIPVSLKDMER